MEEENKLSRVLKVIGVIIMIVGIIGSLVIGTNDKDNTVAILIGGIIGSVISGLLFLGFGEVIELLQLNTNYQFKILSELKKTNKEISKENKE